jgi:hypothetical protein
MPLLGRKRVILAKIETTYGTDPTPTGAANAILVRNLNLNPLEADYADRALIRPYLGRSEQIPTGSRVMVDFEVELQASGTAGTAPGWGVLMRGCAHSETTSAGVSVTYAPISTAMESVTIYFNVDGVLHKLTGARGTVDLSMKVKDIPTLKFTFTGLFNAVSDATLPTPVYTAFKTPLAVTNVNTTPFTLHGISAVMAELSLSMGGNIVHRTLVGGSEQVLITDRQPQGSISIEANTMAVKNWFSTIGAATLGALDITHGTAAGFKCRLQAPNVQLTSPGYSDLDGIQMLGMTMNFVPGSSGNDEYSLVMT